MPNLFSKKQTPARRRRRSEEASPAPTNPFRRGRTLTGSKTLASAAENQAQLKSARAQTHELAGKRRRIGGLLLMVLLLAAGLCGLIWQFTAKVEVRMADGVTVVSYEPYQQAVQEYLAQYPAQRLRFLLDSDALSEFIQQKTPEVAMITQTGAAGLGVSAYELTMRHPIVGWNIGGVRQYVDATGRAFEKNYYASPNVQVVDKSGIPLETGRAVASDRFLGFVGRAVGLAKTYGYKVNEVILPSGTTHAVELKLEGVTYPVKLSGDRPAGEQVEDMARAVKWLHDNGKKPQYVDVRVSGKAYYRE